MSRSMAFVPLALALTFAPAASAGAPEKPPAEAPKEEAVAKGLKGRVFEVKHADPQQVYETVRLLGSGVPGAWISVNRDLRTLTARDYPENLAQIAEAVERLDVAPPERGDVDLSIHVLEARRSDAASGDLPAELKEAVSALRGTLAYKSYVLLTTFQQRVKDGTRNVSGTGSAFEPDPGPRGYPIWMSYDVARVSVSPSAGAPVVTLEGLRFDAETRYTKDGQIQSQHAKMATDVTLRGGEQVVVGTSAMGERGLVLVVSARAAK